MKICFISTMWGYAWGGSELLWAEAAALAARDGHRVTAITHRASVEPAGFRSLGVDFIRRPGAFRDRPSRGFERYFGTFPAIARGEPDVILVSVGSAYDTVHDLELARFLERSRTPYVVLCQHCPEHQILRAEYRDRALKFYRGARHAAFVASRNLETLERQLAGEIPGASVVRNPMNLDSTAAVPWPDRGPAGLACVARLDANYKGQDVLLEALAGDRWRTRDWTLRLYGDGPHREYLAELAGFLGIVDRVEFLGQVSDIRSVWRENHLAVFPSRSEGTPLALVEAMTCGRPSVVTDVGGNAEWVEEPRTGMIAEAPAARSFGPAMERAWEARDRWEAMGSAARRDALDRIDPTPGRTLLDLMIGAVGGPKADAIKAARVGDPS